MLGEVSFTLHSPRSGTQVSRGKKWVSTWGLQGWHLCRGRHRAVEVAFRSFVEVEPRGLAGQKRSWAQPLPSLLNHPPLRESPPIRKGRGGTPLVVQ